MEHPLKIEAAQADVTKIEPAGHAREAARDSLLLIATVKRVGDGAEYNVRVRDLSAGGMKADCPAALNAGDDVTIAMRGIPIVGGRVAWSESGRIGVAFDSEIDPRAARKPVGQGARTPIYAKSAFDTPGGG